MLSGVVSAGYSGYWTWKAGPGNKGLRYPLPSWQTKMSSGDSTLTSIPWYAEVFFTGCLTLLHYENISPVSLERPRWRYTSHVALMINLEAFEDTLLLFYTGATLSLIEKNFHCCTTTSFIILFWRRRTGRTIIRSLFITLKLYNLFC